MNVKDDFCVPSRYYLVLLFLLCFATPVLISTSLNVFIQSAVKDTTYEVWGKCDGYCVLMAFKMKQCSHWLIP